MPLPAWLPNINAYAGERRRLLDLVGGARTLDLGLPPLIALTRDERRAVLGRELGHCAGRPTRLAAASHRGSVALERTVRCLEVMETDQTTVEPPVRLLLKVTKAYNGAYLRQTFAVRRRQELEANARAAGVARARTPARAPWTVHAVAPLWATAPKGSSAARAARARRRRSGDHPDVQPPAAPLAGAAQHTAWLPVR